MKKPSAAAESHLLSKINYFAILGLEEAFKINLEKLEENYFHMQKKYHPDNFDDMKISADLNKAYMILRNDYSRAVYILSLYDIDLKREDDKRDLLDKSFLAYMLELNETLSFKIGFTELEEFLEILKQERFALIRELADDFEKENLHSGSLNTQKLKYYDNLIKLAEDKISKCF